jgi:lysylphosphatidylglycerol synthetase-like protein (DUF2156 family)
MFFFTALRRAFAANPHAVAVTEAENATLAASGVQQPTMQTYFAWRRSLMVFVVFASLLGAALSTYREFAETSGRRDIVETMTKKLPPGLQILLPAATDAAKDMMEEGEEDDETDKPAAATSKAEANSEADEPETVFGKFTDFVQLIALYTLPVAALAVVVLWTRLKLTFQIIVAAFLFSFLLPMVLALCPWSWWGYVEPDYSLQKQPLEYFRQTAEGLLEGATYLVTLLPTVLSLVPGVQRACLRVKMLLPQSVLAGWFLVVASPFYALFLFVIFVAINQFNSHPLFFVGMLVFLLAPLTYPVRADVFTHPLSLNEDDRRIRGVQRIVAGLTAVAGALLVTYLASRDVMGVRLLGLDYKHALLVPLDIVEFFLETISRSMFVTVLGADLFMRMNLAAWKNARDFHGTPEAQAYDDVMGEFERIQLGTTN